MVLYCMILYCMVLYSSAQYCRTLYIMVQYCGVLKLKGFLRISLKKVFWVVVGDIAITGTSSRVQVETLRVDLELNFDN